MKVVDKLSGGWMSHFITIVLIEMIEGYVIVIYFRFFRKGVVKLTDREFVEEEEYVDVNPDDQRLYCNEHGE